MRHSGEMKWLPVLVVAGLLLSACSGGGDVGGPPQVSAPTGSAASESSTPSAEATLAEGSPTPVEQRSAAEQQRLDEQLIEAAWADDVQAARRLIQRGADVNWRDESVQSAFLIAASEGHLDLLNLTLDNGADVDLHDSFDGTALIRAAERGHWDIVGRLLQTDIEVDHVNNLGWVALHEAIVLGADTPEYVATVRALIAGGADLTITPERDGIAPVDHARQRNQDTAATALGRAARKSTVSNPDAALIRAASGGDADGVALAIRAGADLETQDDRGQTPLLLASAADQVAAARVLLALGADPDAYDDQSDTPWLVTGVTGSVAMAEVMLPFHPDLTLRNRFGGISIIPASERGHVDYVRRVVQTDIDVNHVNDLGWTALLEAVILGDGTAPYVEIVEVLLDAGADPAIADKDGTTARQHALNRDFTDIVRALDR